MSLVSHLIQQTRPHHPGVKFRQHGQLTQIVEVGGDAAYPGGVKRIAQFEQCVQPVFTVDDDFGNHRIVKGADFAAGADPAVHPHVGRETHLGEYAGAGLEIFQRIFGIDTDFNRRAGGYPRHGLPVEGLLCRQPDHALNKIEAGDHFGNRMLHLQAGVDLQKIERVPGGFVDKLHRTRAAVVHRFTQCYSGL